MSISLLGPEAAMDRENKTSIGLGPLCCCFRDLMLILPMAYYGLVWTYAHMLALVIGRA